MTKQWEKLSDYDRLAFNRWLLQAIAERGWTQTKLAKLAEVNRGTLDHALGNDRLLTPVVRQKLINALTDDGQRETAISRHDLWLISGIDRFRYAPPNLKPALLDSNRSFAERAEIAALQAAWIPAESFWRAAANEERRTQRWVIWARYTLNAATMAHHRGDLRTARHDLDTVLDEARRVPLGEGAVIEALIRRGWGEYRQAHLRVAHDFLEASLAKLGRWQPRPDEEFRLVVHQNLRVCDGPTAKWELLHLAKYNFGRTLIEIGLKDEKETELIRRRYGIRNILETGLAAIDEAERIEQKELKRGQQSNNDWLTSLRRVAALDRLAADGYVKKSEVTKHLHIAQEVGSPYVTGDARASLERALSRHFRGDDHAASHLLEQARAEFIGPVFYGPGVADVLRSEAKIAEGSGNLARAVERSLGAVMLHPYGDNVTVFEDAVSGGQGGMTDGEYLRYLRQLFEAAQSAHGEAFTELPLLHRSITAKEWDAIEQKAGEVFENATRPYRRGVRS